MRDELLHGEIILSPSPKVPHQDLCWDGGEGPRPDVFVIDPKRWAEASQSGGYPIGSPQLIVQVRSASDDWAHFEKKAALFLADGALAVWIVALTRRLTQIPWRLCASVSIFSHSRPPKIS